MGKPEEDLSADPKAAIDEACGSGPCLNYKKQLEACTERVQANPDSGETCTQELFDFAHCVDNCGTAKLFAKMR